MYINLLNSTIYWAAWANWTKCELVRLPEPGNSLHYTSHYYTRKNFITLIELGSYQGQGWRQDLISKCKSNLLFLLSWSSDEAGITKIEQPWRPLFNRVGVPRSPCIWKGQNQFIFIDVSSKKFGSIGELLLLPIFIPFVNLYHCCYCKLSLRDFLL